MNLSFSPKHEAFRDEVRAFLRERLTDDLVRATRLNTSVFSEPDVCLRWQRILHERGWVAPAWPVEYGGTGWTLVQRWIFETECARAGAPPLSPHGPADGRAGDHAASARPSRRRATCRGSCRARTTGARATPSRARAPTSPR